MNRLAAKFATVLVVAGCVVMVWAQGADDVARARQFLLRGEAAAARPLLNALVAKYPHDPDVRYLAGLAAIQTGEPRAALVHLREACRLAPASIEARKLLAKAFVLSGEEPEAESAIKEWMRRSPRDAEAWLTLGKLYLHSARYGEAVPALEKARGFGAADAMALGALANAYEGAGEFDRAVAAFEAAVAANERATRRMAAPHASFAILLLRLNRDGEAAEQVRRAEAIDRREATTREARRALDARLSRARAGPAKTVPGANACPRPPRFEDIAIRAGIDFRLENSPTPAKHQIETMPGGVAVLDYDNDGWLDIYFTNGAESPSLKKTGARFWNRLYRNNGDLTFTDVTVRAGVAGEGYTMAAAVGDFDNDGYADMFVAGVARHMLYHNNGDGTFTDIAGSAGFNRPDPRYGQMWGIHAAWVDYDQDGWLDLFLVNYCGWDPRTEPFCGDKSRGRRDYCHPRYYAALPNQLFHNNHDGTFTDVSAQAGIAGHLGKGMGAAVADFDLDGRPDIFVANDTEPNFLFHNEGQGQFREEAMANDVALNEFGRALSFMGADFRDLDNDGRPDLFLTALSYEGFQLYQNHANGFDEISAAAGIALPTLARGGWSNAIADLNNDGWKDLFAAGGHTLDNIDEIGGGAYRQPNAVFEQVGRGVFRDVSAQCGADFQRRGAHRGAAIGDFDNDGRLDIVVTALGDRPELFHNITPGSEHWLIVKLLGTKSDRPGLGAVLKLTAVDGSEQWDHATTSVGFASSSDSRVHFGLGAVSGVRSLEIQWPSGIRQVVPSPAIDRVLAITEPHEESP